MKAPIQTENVAMGVALNLAGVSPWLDKYFAFVVYDEATVKRLGCETIKEAVAKGLCGHRVCNFDMSDSEKFDALKQVWDEEKSRIEAGLPSNLSEGVQAADIVRIVARTFHARKQMTEHWPDLPIFAHIGNGIPNVGEPGADGEVLISHPGYRMVNIRASQATLARLGLAIAPADEEEAE